jgi:hypothetical protein
MEFSALANHRKAIRAELAAYAEQFRRLETEAVAAVLTRADADADALAPEAVAVLMTSISRILVLEEALGMTTGHAAMRALVEQYLERYEGPGSRA